MRAGKILFICHLFFGLAQAQTSRLSASDRYLDEIFSWTSVELQVRHPLTDHLRHIENDLMETYWPRTTLFSYIELSVLLYLRDLPLAHSQVREQTLRLLSIHDITERLIQRGELFLLNSSVQQRVDFIRLEIFKSILEAQISAGYQIRIRVDREAEETIDSHQKVSIFASWIETRIRAGRTGTPLSEISASALVQHDGSFFSFRGVCSKSL